MRRLVLLLALAAAPVAMAQAQAPTPSPAQRQAQQEVQRDQAEDRVTDAARELSAGGRVGSPPLLEDLNRDRPGLTRERLSTPGVTSRSTTESGIPLLSDNPQR
ncbi:hypothetical protein EAH89_04900 [Roseomonas nepalensis]|uniref:DUF4148 domain-containing protein n=1 Tax=Muricoccus nepalensis TaxID=1854500 RepID=A0A502GFV0_9PROT|nr:hypothetical protein [Roseomonas nepalensis]TPG59583.1 hypothetical protein EAH89_04900 [Roseomonas nepalensis]